MRALLEKKPNPVAYDGFEPSGRMHIAQGVLKALNVNKLTKSGVTFRFWCVYLSGIMIICPGCLKWTVQIMGYGDLHVCAYYIVADWVALNKF